MLQRLDYKPDDYQEQIITEKYAILKSKIFYLYQPTDKLEVQLNSLFFDFEDLIEEKSGHAKMNILKSPLQFKGSSMFLDFYYYCRTRSTIHVFNRPDIC